MNNALSDQDVTAVQNILMEQLSVTREQILPEASIVGDLTADSLDVIEINMALEEHFNLALPDEPFDPAMTVGELYELVANQREPSARSGSGR